jgi:transposase
MLPTGLGFGSGVTCWRRLRDWQKAGVWRELQRVLLDELGKAALVDWARVSVDSATVPAKGGSRDRAQSSRSG